MSVIDHIKQPIAEELETFNRRFRGSMRSKVFLLDVITRYVLKTKGKQLRPILVLLAAKTFGRIDDKVYTAATLIELLHTASLVHDDVVDEAERRRGFLSIHRIWNSKTAVLFGDYLLARGLITSVDNQTFDLLRIVAVAVEEMSEGELLQLEYSRRQRITREEYFEVIRKKTAVLLAACVEAGAQAGGATEQQVASMRQFGVLLGLIFQIKDDLLDYQPTGVTGKVSGNDLKEKKYTLPLIYALSKASDSERRQIVRLVGSSAPDRDKLRTVTAFITSHAAEEHCYATMRELGDQAMAVLDEFPRNEASESLRTVVNYAIDRKR